MPYTTEQIRNVALAGHPGAGKTLLFDALLHAGGAIAATGSIERGSTTSDFDPMERQRGHSLDAAIASVDHGGIHLNLIDTPGYPDFRGPALSALAAVETVAIVVDADTGIGYGTRRMMEHARARGLCRVLVVNKLDHDGVGTAALLESLRETFGPEVLPLNLPADGGTRVVDCFGAGAAESTESSDAGPVADWHRRIIDQVVEVNETVMDHYLDLGEGGLSGEDIPLPARIVCVADVFDALVSPRPYKQAWSIEEALAYLSGQRGALFDPACVDALLREEGRLRQICEQASVPAGASRVK